jgi:mono/diheme cytochrome c family protein
LSSLLRYNRILQANGNESQTGISPEFPRTIIIFRVIVIATLVLLARSAINASAFPWSIDMFRGDAVQPMAEAPRVMPSGTLPVNGERPRSTAASRRLQNPLASLPKNVEEGGKLYSVYCSVCHGPGGHGDGPVKFMLRTPPADLTSHRVVVMKDGSIYGTIRNGTEIMPSYGDALTPAERWRVVLFVRALQQKGAIANGSPSADQSPHPRSITAITGQ